MEFMPTKEYLRYLAKGDHSYTDQEEHKKKELRDTSGFKSLYIPRDEAQVKEFYDNSIAYAENCPLEDLTISSYEGLTALHYLAIANLYDAVEILLKRGADPNVRGTEGEDGYDHSGMTPLHLVVDHANVRMVKLLLDNGADCTLTDAKGNNVFHFLSGHIRVKYQYDYSDAHYFRERREILDMLTGDINKSNSDGETPLQFIMMCTSSNDRMGDMLAGRYMARGADVTVRDEEGNTPLMIAVKHRFANALYDLAKDKDTLNLQNNDGNTALHLIAKDYDESLLEFSEYVKRRGQKEINLSVSFSDTELAMAYTLIKSGADFTIPNNNGDVFENIVKDPESRYGEVIARTIYNKDNVNMMKKILARKKDIKFLWGLFDCMILRRWEDEEGELHLIKGGIVADILRLVDPDDDTEIKYVTWIISKFSKPDKTPLLRIFAEAGFDLNQKIVIQKELTTLAVEFAKYAWANPDIIKVLRECGVDVDAVQPTGYTLAYYFIDGMLENAVRNSWSREIAYKNIFEALSYVSAESLTDYDKGESAAYYIVRCFDEEKGLPDYILDRGIDVNAVCCEDYTLLMGAIIGKNLKIARRLLEMGADETMKNSNGDCAVHFMTKAIGKDGFYDTLDMFSEIDAEADDDYNKTMFMDVIRNHHDNIELVKYMLERGVEVNRKNKHKDTLIMSLAREFDAGETIRLLAAAGANLDAQDRKGNTAIMIAVSQNRIPNVRALIECGADLSLKNDRDDTAAEIAMDGGRSECAEIITKALLEQQSKVTRKRQKTKKTFKISVWMGNFEKHGELRDYKEKYDRHGNIICAEFTSNFGLSCNKMEKIHIGFNDTETKPHYKDAESLLKFFGINKENAPQFEKLLEGGKLDKYNSIVMMYDCDYKGDVQNDGKMEFIGCVDVVSYSYRYVTVNERKKPLQKVSMWLGWFECYDDLEGYMLKCRVFSDFKDHYRLNRERLGEIRHRWCHNSSGNLTLNELLEQFRGEKQLLPQFEKLLNGRDMSKYNSIIVIYDFEYEGKAGADKNTVYIGCAAFDSERSDDDDYDEVYDDDTYNPYDDGD